MIHYIFLSIKWAIQRMFRGYDDSDTWDVGNNVIEFSYPRLVAYYEAHRLGYPSGVKNTQEWERILDQIILAFQTYLIDADLYVFNKQINDDAYKEAMENKNYGFKLFGKWIESLWD